MWKPTFSAEMPAYWPPRPSRFWATMLEPARRHYLRRVYKIASIQLAGLDRLKKISPTDGCLICPNHSHDSDPHVMIDVGRQIGRPLYFMAAWQIFQMHHGLDGWAMQRMGAFSVDREGCDRRAMRQTVDLLKAGRHVVVFPEGEVYHLNDRLSALREGVAFMAVSAQKDLADSLTKIWIVPTAIRYKYVEDITPNLSAAMSVMERRMMLTPRADLPLPDRIVRLGETLLTIKEKEMLGSSRESAGDLPTRIRGLMLAILQKLEAAHGSKPSAGDTVPLRVKVLRRKLLETWTDEKADAAAKKKVEESLGQVQLVMQLYSYPGDYVSGKPSLERMAETIEKFEEDLEGISYPKGPRNARVIFGEPIDVKTAVAATRLRTAAADLTAKMETEIGKLMV